MELSKVIESRLKSIQQKYNFNPEVGAEQINSDMKIEYGAFKELVTIIEQAKLDVIIPYDPAGHSPQDYAKKKKERPFYIYFIRKGKNEWKIGRSWNPSKRKQELQVGNEGKIVVYKKVQLSSLEEVIDIESKLKKHTRKYKLNGEWRKLSVMQINNLIKALKNKDFSSFDKLLPRPKEKAFEV